MNYIPMSNIIKSNTNDSNKYNILGTTIHGFSSTKVKLDSEMYLDWM